MPVAAAAPDPDPSDDIRRLFREYSLSNPAAAQDLLRTLDQELNRPLPAPVPESVPLDGFYTEMLRTAPADPEQRTRHILTRVKILRRLLLEQAPTNNPKPDSPALTVHDIDRFLTALHQTDPQLATIAELYLIARPTTYQIADLLELLPRQVRRSVFITKASLREFMRRT